MISLTLMRASRAFRASTASSRVSLGRMPGWRARTGSVVAVAVQGAGLGGLGGAGEGRGLALAAFAHRQRGLGIGRADLAQDLLEAALVVGGFDVVADIELDRDLTAKLHNRPRNE